MNSAKINFVKRKKNAPLTLFDLDFEYSGCPELIVAVNGEDKINSGFITYIIRECSPFNFPPDLLKPTDESELISGGGGLRFQFSIESKELCYIYVPILHGFIDDVFDDIELIES